MKSSTNLIELGVLMRKKKRRKKPSSSSCKGLEVRNGTVFFENVPMSERRDDAEALAAAFLDRYGRGGLAALAQTRRRQLSERSRARAFEILTPDGRVHDVLGANSEREARAEVAKRLGRKRLPRHTTVRRRQASVVDRDD